MKCCLHDYYQVTLIWGHYFNPLEIKLKDAHKLEATPKFHMRDVVKLKDLSILIVDYP